MYARHREPLLAHSLLDARQAERLASQRAELERAESAWAARRGVLLPTMLRALRSEAATMRRELQAALGYFCGDDEQVLRRLEAIRRGEGLADLLQDLVFLADLTDTQAHALVRAELPQGTPRATAARARKLAALLSDREAARAIDTDAAEARLARNRAFWQLRATMDAIRAAGRYVFRNQPAVLRFFRSSDTRMRHRKAKAAAKPKDSGDPTEP